MSPKCFGTRLEIIISNSNAPFNFRWEFFLSPPTMLKTQCTIVLTKGYFFLNFSWTQHVGAESEKKELALCRRSEDEAFDAICSHCALHSRRRGGAKTLLQPGPIFVYGWRARHHKAALNQKPFLMSS